MDKQKIKNLIEKGESEKTEFKESLKTLNEIGETISAFSNSNSGIILAGVSDLEKLIGVSIGKNTIENLANYIKRNTDPQIYPSIEFEKIENKKVILIKVIESKEKPVFFKSHAYKRVGKTNLRLSSSEIRKLAKETGEKVYWDEQICGRATIEDIDWDFVEKDFIPLYEKISEKRIAGKFINLLISLGCIKNNKPTNSGILFFGKNPQKNFRNSYIALARYKGDAVLGEKLDYKEFTGNLFQQINECNKYIVEHTALMSRLIPGEVRRRDISEYGKFSLRELITNAICHRDYEDQRSKIIIKIFSDRIEFYNIGGLPEWITPKNIISEQYSRNPTIAKILAKVEYIEELGEGWDKIIKEHKEHLLSPKMPEIKSSRNSTLIILFSIKEKFEKGKSEFNERQERAMEYIRVKDQITNANYQKINKTTKKTATRDLQDFIKRDIFIRKGRTGKGVYYILNSIYKGDIRGHKGT